MRIDALGRFFREEMLPPLAVSPRFFPHGLAPEELSAIQSAILDQVNFEKSLRFKDNVSVINSHVKFNVNSLMSICGAEEISKIWNDYVQRDDIDLVDVGGGRGVFIQRFKKIMFSDGYRVNPTMTSLVDYFQVFGQRRPKDVQFRIVSAELPPDDFYQAFDLTASFNGPLQWSKYPELVLDNLIKMTKPGGALFLMAGENFYHPDFNLERAIDQRSGIYFHSEVVTLYGAKDSNKYIVYHFVWLE